jgi:hypothetical protein
MRETRTTICQQLDVTIYSFPRKENVYILPHRNRSIDRPVYSKTVGYRAKNVMKKENNRFSGTNRLVSRIIN